jgi:arylformamidase
MDQKELDDAYDQNVWASNRSQVLARQAANSESVRQRLGNPQRHSYGPTPIEALDVYPANRSNAPVNVFIHGGAWRDFVAKNWAFPAEMFVQSGAHYVVPDFAWVQDVGGSLTAMADQVRRAVTWVYHNAQRFGGDPNRIYISGHSSGGHLAGVMLTTDWREVGLPSDTLKGGVLMSGLFDLKPVRLSARSNYVAFTDQIEQALSPQRHLDKLTAPLVVGYAALDSPEFQRQSRDFAAAAKGAGKAVQLLVAEAYNHLEAPETFGNPYGLFGRAALEQMRLV